MNRKAVRYSYIMLDAMHIYNEHGFNCVLEYLKCEEE